MGDFPAVFLEKQSETLSGVAEIGRDNRDVCEKWHVPGGENTKCSVVQAEFQRTERGKSDLHWGAGWGERFGKYGAEVRGMG